MNEIRYSNSQGRNVQNLCSVDTQCTNLIDFDVKTTVSKTLALDKLDTIMEVDEELQEKQTKVFDHKKYAKRHVALMVAYLGWDYEGFVVQQNAENTIEKHLFDALNKTMLIDGRETSNYHRCGRTDKGVSAFRQVISIDLRSNLTEGRDIFVPDGHVVQHHKASNDSRHELNYPAILNRVLPTKIRILAWATVPRDFSSRFDCKSRTYRYYFPKANLNTEVKNDDITGNNFSSALNEVFFDKAMQLACRHLLGEHDFRNFCKVDMTNNRISHCIREVTEAKIIAPESNSRFETFKTNCQTHITMHFYFFTF